MSFGSQGDLETTSKLEVRICGRMGANKGMSAAKINPNPVEVRHWMSGGNKGVKLQNIWGMWRRKSILEMNGRCTVWVEIAKWFKQVKWFEIVTCLRTLWIFSFFLLLQKLSLLETEASCRLWVTAFQSVRCLKLDKHLFSFEELWSAGAS